MSDVIVYEKLTGKKHVLHNKGDDMKQAEITITTKDGVSKITDWKNVLTYQQICKEVGTVWAREYINGAFFFLVPHERQPYIRFGVGDLSKTLYVGDRIYDVEKFASLLHTAGARLSKMLNGKTTTIKV